MDEILKEEVIRSKGWYVHEIHYEEALKEKHDKEMASTNSIFKARITYPGMPK